MRPRGHQRRPLTPWCAGWRLIFLVSSAGRASRRPRRRRRLDRHGCGPLLANPTCENVIAQAWEPEAGTQCYTPLR